MLLFTYLIYIIFSYVTKEKVKVYEVVEGSMVTDTKHRGLILKSEIVYNSISAGNINYFIREAKYAGVGTKIYSIDGTGAINKFIKDNDLDELSISNSDLSSIKNELSEFVSEYKDLNFESVYDAKYLLNSSMLEFASISSLENLDEKLKKQNMSYTEVISDKTGMISFIIDGLENINLENITTDNFNEENYKVSHIKAGTKVDENVPVYKIIDKEDWEIIFRLTDEEAKEYAEKTKLNIRFLNNDLELLVPYRNIVNSEGINFGVLSMDKYLVEFLSDRFVNFEVEINKAKGLKIPKKAVFDKEFYKIPLNYITKGGGSNNYGVLKEVYTENGTSIEFTEVDIYGLDEEFYYIDMEDENKIKSGDYIINENTTERYQVGEIGILSGVYNINKGYALFKKINILTSNDEYYTIEKGTKYGLNVYDHILINPQKYNNKDFIYN